MPNPYWPEVLTISLDIYTLTNSLNIHTLTIMIQCTCMLTCTLKHCVCFKNCDDHMTLWGYACLELWNAKHLCVSRTLMITWRSEDMHVWSCGMPNICVFQELWWSHDALKICMHIWSCGLLKGCMFQELWWPHVLLKSCLELGIAEGVYMCFQTWWSHRKTW